MSRASGTIIGEHPVTIIGGGFTGAMLAVRLAEQGRSVRLVNRTPAFGLGVAYSTRCDLHLLNVRSGRMSARADDPDHFVRWLAATHPALADPQGFAPRRIYGEYVRDTLTAAVQTFPGRIETVVGEATEATPDGVRLADGRWLDAGALVLATGNPPPRTGLRAAGMASDPWIRDPWVPGALDSLGPSHDVVIIGTGLTMIDVLLSLADRGWVGQAVALSRRGLTPRPHDAAQPHVAPSPPPPGPLSQRLAWARRESARVGWADMMDGLRDLNADLWRGLSPDERSRFLRILRPWWDVHRHRVAPEPARRIREMMDDGRLRIVAGRIRSIETRPGSMTVRWRPRGDSRILDLPADRVIDCTGPGHDPLKPTAPLMASLLASGLARADAHGLGFEVDEHQRLIAADGRVSDRLYMVGPPARAAFWEVIAVPDIRKRIDALVARL